MRAAELAHTCVRERERERERERGRMYVIVNKNLTHGVF